MKTIKELIEKELKNNVSQVELAKRIGVSQATIYKILYFDNQYTLPTLEKISRYFRISISDLTNTDNSYQSPVSKKGELTEEEKWLLETYRAISNDGREAVRHMVGYFHEQQILNKGKNIGSEKEGKH